MDTPIPQKMTEIYLVRHGETTLSGAGQYIGSSDIPLSENGKNQARRLAETLIDVHIDACYCSPMERCRETAHILAMPHQLDLIPVPNIREIDYGDWEGLTLAEMETAAPETFRIWKHDPAGTQAPNGESGEDVLNRIRPAFETIVSNHVGQRVLIVAHRTVNRIWLCHLLGHPIASYRKAIGQDFTALNIVEYIEHDECVTYSVTLLNGTGHLEEWSDAGQAKTGSGKTWLGSK